VTLRWVATDLKTSGVLAYLPSLLPQWPIRRTIGQYGSAQATLVVDANIDPSWERATLEGGAVLHCYDDTPNADGTVPRTLLWSGIVLNSSRQAATNTVALGLATAEAYLAGREVGDVAYTAQSIAFIVQDLITRFAADADGIPLATQISGGATVIASLVYNATDNATVYQRLQELAARAGGPEWMIDWAWSADGQSILPTLIVADRLGSSPSPGLLPSARFTMPGCLVDAQFDTNYSSGKGANSVVAYSSSGQGSVTPTSARQSAPYNGRPRWDHRYAPSGAVTSQADLDGFAARTAANMGEGARSVSLVAALTSPATPRYRQDWVLGDDVAYGLGGDLFVAAGQLDVIEGGGSADTSLEAIAGGGVDASGVTETVDANPQPGVAQSPLTAPVIPTFPHGLTGVGRAMAYEITETTLTPLLADPPLEA